MSKTDEPGIRNIDLVNSSVATKFFILSRDEELTITTFDHPLDCSNINLISEYYSISRVNGQNQYKYKFTVPAFLKRSNNYILLLDLKTKRGDDVLIYLDKAHDAERSLLTIYNPKDDLTAIVHPGSIIEVVFIDPNQPLSIPRIDDGPTTFNLEFLRREIVNQKDEVFRPNRRIFDINRWVYNYPQCHFFFRVDPKDYEMLSRMKPEGQIFGPTIKFMNSGKEVSLKVKVNINKTVKEQIAELSKDTAIEIANEGSTYGLETGFFGGAQIMSRNSHVIKVDQELGHQEIEIPVPGFQLTDWPKDGFSHNMNRYEPFNATGRIQSNGFRVVNRTFLQKFLVINDMDKGKSANGISIPIGTAEFTHGGEKIVWPVYVGDVEHARNPKTTTPPLNAPEAKERFSPKIKQALYEIAGSTYYKKIRVAKEVRLIKIENNNQLLTVKVKQSTERLIENPESDETICMFPDESLNIRLSSSTCVWQLTHWPSFLCSSGTRFSKDFQQFRFKISPCYAFPHKKSHMLFESGSLKKKIFIKIID